MWLPLAADRRRAVDGARPQGAQPGPQGREERLHGRGRRRRAARRLLQRVRATTCATWARRSTPPLLRRGAARVSRTRARVRRARWPASPSPRPSPSAGATASRCPGRRRCRAHPRQSPNNAAVLDDAASRRFSDGYRTFDFGRSTPDEGTFHFKKQWGAAPPLHWEYWLAAAARCRTRARRTRSSGRRLPCGSTCPCGWPTARPGHRAEHPVASLCQESSASSLPPLPRARRSRVGHGQCADAFFLADAATVQSDDDQAALGSVLLDAADARAGTWKRLGMLSSFEGELYEPGEAHARLVRRGTSFDSDAFGELLAQGVWIEGAPFLDALRGYFAAALWDSERQRLTLVTDRFGMRPLYWTHWTGGLAFASEVSALLRLPGVSSSLSHRGLGQFFAFGQFLGDATFYEGVTTDAPGLDADLRRTWRYASTSTPTSLRRCRTSPVLASASSRTGVRRPGKGGRAAFAWHLEPWPLAIGRPGRPDHPGDGARRGAADHRQPRHARQHRPSCCGEAVLDSRTGPPRADA